MTTFKVVPDVLREREPLTRGRIPRNPISKALLNGQTVFITGPKKTWGSLYTLAKNHGKIAKTKRTTINSEDGTLAWFEEVEKVESDEGPSRTNCVFPRWDATDRVWVCCHGGVNCGACKAYPANCKSDKMFDYPDLGIAEMPFGI